MSSVQTLSNALQAISADPDKAATLKLSLSPGIGPQRLQQLLDCFESPAAAWVSSQADWQTHGLSDKQYFKLDRFRQSFSLEKFFSLLHRFEINLLFKSDSNYPALLSPLSHAPHILYFQSSHQQFILPDINLAIVGTRKISQYGRSTISRFVPDIVKQDVSIVSGLMYGVDEAAHRTALQSGGFTIGVWAGGLDSLQIGSRQPLARDILHSGGILLSEYPPGFKPSPQTFPARNRIVAGLSQATLVVEGTEKSGTLITAGYAAEQGREVLAIPGPINALQSAAPHILIKNGAQLVTNSQDILRALGIADTRSTNQLDLDDFTEIQQAIIRLIQQNPAATDQLANQLQQPVTHITAQLTTLELQGVIIHSGGTWQIH